MNRTDFSRSRTSGPASLHGSAPPTLFRTRSRRGRKVLAAVVFGGLLTIPAAWSGATDEAEPRPGAQSAEVSASGRTATVDEPAERPAKVDQVEASRAFATFEDLTLRLPGREVMLVGYHEASFHNALEMVPIGDALANDNRTKFEPSTETADGPEYVILSSRGRPTPATSAIDVVLDDATTVLAPVSGLVREVRPYLLYGKHADTRIEIIPEGRPDLALVMIHVQGVQVEVGDEVEAGVTAIAAGPTRFPFGSQIDRFFDPERWPHVHIEIKRR